MATESGLNSLIKGAQNYIAEQSRNNMEIDGKIRALEAAEKQAYQALDAANKMRSKFKQYEHPKKWQGNSSSHFKNYAGWAGEYDANELVEDIKDFVGKIRDEKRALAWKKNIIAEVITNKQKEIEGYRRMINKLKTEVSKG